MKVSKALVSLLVVAAIAAQTAPANAQACPGNVVTNGGFNLNTVINGDGSLGTTSSHTNAWIKAYGSPQLQGGAGCHDPDYVSFWGNQAVGEAIQQPIALVPGQPYEITFCVRFHPDPPKVPTSGTVFVRGSTAQLSSPACPSATCETLFTTSSISSTAWQTVKGCFTPTKPDTILTLSPSNGSNVNDGAQVSFMQIDDVCIRPVKSVIEGPGDTCTTPSTYCVKPPASGPFAWTLPPGATSTPINGDGSCIAVNWPAGSGGGVIQVTSTVDGCKVTSQWPVRKCPHPSCCVDDVNPKATSSDLGLNTLNVVFNNASSPANEVRATIIGAWRTAWSCGSPGPIAATAAAAQPAPPSPWLVSVPVTHGNQVTWSSSGALLGTQQFPMTFDLPPTGGTSCNDTITVVVQFDVTFAGTPTRPCHTCSMIRTFTWKRCPLCQ